MGVFSKIYNNGVKSSMDQMEAFKYQFTNLLSSLCIVISFIYHIMILMNGGSLLKPAVLTIIFFSTLLLNRYHHIKLSRGFFSFTLPILFFWGHIGLMHPTETPVSGFLLLQVFCLFTPFCIYNTDERKPIVLSVLWAFVFICAIYQVTGVNPEPNSEKYLFFQGLFTIVLGVFALIFIITIIKYTSFSLLRHSDGLLATLEERNQESEKNRLKTEEYIKELQSSRQQEKERQWISKGSGAVAQIFQRGNERGGDVFDEFLGEVVRYLGANQAAFYLVNKEADIRIDMTATYAYGRKKFIQRELLPGEGLVGQAFLEAEPIFMTEIPENYIRITSGLGKSLPRSLAIFPCVNNREVMGLIEIASFEKFSETQLEYLGLVAESAAAYISTFQTNEKTLRLLEESQSQAEQMRTQEEELRQNLEEAHALREEMARQTHEYEALISEKDKEIARLLESQKQTEEA
ncbi:hypothetical protein FUAX_37630 [Fulvitalea axinellae]|uniref:GAF domain-containing protein n=1 Tax=Fulvitalea axinellae TaxID=1182444 RepID=A0AAU9CGN4_9BACT|nr:hypothetical protein FUAX_37630 [Fulvitalea axinellae]